MTSEFQPLSLEGEKKSYSGRWRLVGETLEWEIEGKSFRIESNRDLADRVETIIPLLGRNVFYDKLKLRACLTCKNFRMSGMGRDMGRGQRGTCELHSWGVEICFLCDDYSEIGGTAST